MFARPRLHFTPSCGWINDPNGLIRMNGTYHLFAQHNPDDVVWGPMHWLHATSSDMLHWKEEGIALFPDEMGTIFSGSAAPMQDGRMALMYTSHGQCEQQCAAFSGDGMHFEKYAGNPVIANPGYADFRDPKLFWNERYACWSCVVAAGDHLEFYRSENLTRWEKTGEFGFDPVRFGDLYECPDCFRVPLEDGGEAWVLTASMIFHGETTGCRMRYCVGMFDGDRFVRTDAWPEPLSVEVGYDSYAGVTFAGTEDCTFMTWMSATSCPLPVEGYCGCLSLPRRVRLLETEQGRRIAQTPVLPKYEAAPAVSGQTLPEEPFVLELEADGPFELMLCGTKENEVLAVRLTEKNCIETERSISARFAPDSKYNRDEFRKTSVQRMRRGTVRLQVVCDSWCVEIFADDGLYAHGMLAFAENGYRTLRWSDDVQVRVAALD